MKAGRILFALIFATFFSSPGFACSGNVTWSVWRFDWEVQDGAGLALRNVVFENELILHKASMPVIRVKYAEGSGPNCGPFADHIDWDNLVPTADCGNKLPCQQAFMMDGEEWLEIGVTAHVGKYNLYQAWYFHRSGILVARLYSSGLQCDFDHDHHVYWRLDFDVNGEKKDQIFVHTDKEPDLGFGPGWSPHMHEGNQAKKPSKNRVWAVRDNPTGHRVWVLPGPDGTLDGFSNKDMGSRRYHGYEDEPWIFGADGHLEYLEQENIAGRDVVFWYVAHLHHEKEGGADEWHLVGPTLMIEH